MSQVVDISVFLQNIASTHIKGMLVTLRVSAFNYVFRYVVNGNEITWAVSLDNLPESQPPIQQPAPRACSPLWLCVVWQLDKLFTCRELPAFSASKNPQP